MGLFDWFNNLISGGKAGSGPSQPVKMFAGEGVCPYCGQRLLSSQSRQCFSCGADWHDPNNVVLRGKPTPPPLSTPPPVTTSSQLQGVQAPGVVTDFRALDAARRPPQWQAKPNQLLSGLDDAGPYAPLSSDQIRAQAAWGQNLLWGNGWFGRRDRIPPTSDKRTELIDRGMVGQGLITPAELAEIHRIGLEMDRIRPELDQAHEMARQVVAATKEEKAAIKAQKKAEAAERKRQRAVAIEQRKQTDIIFLGRGVSRGLADCASNLPKLMQLGLPMLATPGNVAQALGISIPQLRWLAFHAETATRTHYVTFTVPKKSGGLRRLSAPHRHLKKCQTWILQNILAKVPVHDAAHGFVPGRSTVTNAQAHVGQAVVVNTDLADFFPTIGFSRVKGTFRSLGYSPAVATILALLCTEAPRRMVEFQGKTYEVATGPRALPQGACTSPALSNLVTRRLDKRLSGIGKKLGWNYTRYADDLTFSASGEAAKPIGYILARVRHIAQDEGFAVNETKTRVQRRHVRQSVTGVVVNDKTNVPRDLVRCIRAILHRAKTEGLAQQNRDNIPHFESWLTGMIAYISMLNPDQGQTLRAAYEALGSQS
ncbi:reverse transcriptase family protein [Anatilimnocola sp. NA78]|uniref:reverse transcriptase family protein n=1 Tax=Anatilimnocola sp. NA78 TaxID=3415683 RepID=UPI003CE50865